MHTYTYWSSYLSLHVNSDFAQGFYGVGDDAYSWAVDGHRCAKFHVDQARYFTKPPHDHDGAGMILHESPLKRGSAAIPLLCLLWESLVVVCYFYYYSLLLTSQIFAFWPACLNVFTMCTNHLLIGTCRRRLQRQQQRRRSNYSTSSCHRNKLWMAHRRRARLCDRLRRTDDRVFPKRAKSGRCFSKNINRRWAGASV